MRKRLNRLGKLKRSIIRRLLSKFVNGSDSYILQYLPDFVFSEDIDFQAFRRVWIHGHEKNNDSDLFRMLFIMMNMNQVLADNVTGDIAELGVFKGNCAKLLNQMVPKDRNIFLLDTFEGFSDKDLNNNEPSNSVVGDFSAGLEEVKAFVGNDSRISYIAGYFPETATKIPESTRFSFVNLDVDLYSPIKSGLEYFYPRMTKGGIIAIHDYANSCWPGVKKAVDEFLADKNEQIIVLPDRSGTATFRKC